MTSSIHAPELALSCELEVSYEGFEPDQENLEHVQESASIVQKETKPVHPTHADPKWWKWKYRWIILGGLAVAYTIAVVVGPVVRTQKSR